MVVLGGISNEIIACECNMCKQLIKKEDINNEAHNECYYSLTPSRKEIFLEMKTELEQQGILSYKGGREY